MKNILVLAHGDEGQEARLQVALDVTRALGGHLHCLQVDDLPMIVSDYYGSGTDALVLEEARDRASLNRRRLEARLAGEDVAWSIGETFETVVSALNYAADLADLIVVSSRRANEGLARRPEILPLRARRPVLAVPPEARGLDTGGRVLIAWDGSRPCVEAVRGAVPLLRCAREVALLEVNQPDGAFAMTHIAQYLSRHAIGVELVERRTDGVVADLILSHARHREADLLVMGAYSLPRLVEAAFGGTTRTVLLEAPMPVLVAH